MARIRTIKPQFFTSEDIVSLSPLARLLYIGLWCEADREGRLEWRLGALKMRYLPGDDCDIHALADELTRAPRVPHACPTRAPRVATRLPLVVTYGDGLAWIPTFSKHQMINNREQASRLPPYSEDLRTRAPRVPHACPTRAPRVPHAASGEDAASGEGKGREGKGREERLPASPAPSAGSSGVDQPQPKSDDSTTPAQPEAPNVASRHQATIALWCRIYLEERATTYRLNGGDAPAVKRLLGWPEATDEEIERRARLSLLDQFSGHGMTLAKLVSQWSAWSQPRPEGRKPSNLLTAADMARMKHVSGRIL